MPSSKRWIPADAPARRRRLFRRGLTLIEVVAGLAILGTLLAYMVVARARYLHQWALAGRTQQATTAADELLSDWWSNPDKFPRESQGEIRKLNLLWKTHLVENRAAKELQVQVVRLELFDQVRSTPEATSTTLSTTPLVQVDVVLNKDQDSPPGVGKSGVIPNPEKP